MKVTGIGKSLNEAIENGLKELGVSSDQVSVAVINAGGGLFGGKCKVELTLLEKTENIEETCEKEKILEEKKEILEEKDEIINESLESKVEEIKTESSKISKPSPLETFEQEQASNEAVIELISEFISGLGEAAGQKIKALVQISDENIEVSVKGEGAGNFIGNNGESLQAIQFLVNSILHNKLKESRRVYLDIDGYKAQREEELISMAKRLAKQVAKTKRPFKLRYMNAYERRIVHTALQNDLLVETFSSGVEPRRYLTITIKK